MGGVSQAKNHPYEYIVASALSAFINYPLWRASAIGQSGFRVQSINRYQLTATYMNAFSPPYKGCIATICGMTWARAAIFWGSDRGKEILKSVYPDIHPSIHTLFPPLMISTVVQCVNQPVVRASVTLQNPDSNIPNVRAAVRSIYESHGMKGLWHGTVRSYFLCPFILHSPLFRLYSKLFSITLWSYIYCTIWNPFHLIEIN